MTIVAIGSTRGSPGVTTLATGLAFAAVGIGGRRPLLIEADPAGGVLGLRFNLAMQSSFASLASHAGRSSSPSLLVEHGVNLAGVQCLAAPADYLITKWIIGRSASYLSQVLPLAMRPTVIDIGRIEQDSPALALAKAADIVLLVARPTLEEAQSVLFGARTLNAAGCRASLVVVGQHPHDPMELADLAGLRLRAVLPDDPKAAAALAGGNHSARSFKRTTLWRSITALADGFWSADVRPPSRSKLSDLPPPAQGERPQNPDRIPAYRPTLTGAPTAPLVENRRPTGSVPQPPMAPPASVARPQQLVRSSSSSEGIQWFPPTEVTGGSQ